MLISPSPSTLVSWDTLMQTMLLNTNPSLGTGEKWKQRDERVGMGCKDCWDWAGIVCCVLFITPELLRVQHSLYLFFFSEAIYGCLLVCILFFFSLRKIWLPSQIVSLQGAEATALVTEPCSLQHSNFRPCLLVRSISILDLFSFRLEKLHHVWLCWVAVSHCPSSSPWVLWEHLLLSAREENSSL